MKDNINKIIDIIKDSGIILLVFIGINILLSSILFICHISTSFINILLSFILTAIFVVIFYNKRDKKQVLISAIISILVFMTSIYICAHTYDTTWDGNTYHKLAVGMLKDGWNPVYQSAKSFIEDDITDVGILDDGRNSIWIEHYPKASWIFAANMYSVTNNIEASKIINILVIYIAFTIITSYLYKKTNIVFAILISFLICVNPISIVQVFSYYIDGLMGILIYIILCTLISLSDREIQKDRDSKWIDKQNWLILGIALIICINLKFTGLAYAGVFCIMFFGFWVYKAYKEKKIKEKLIKYISYYMVVVLIAICIVGYSSYIKNIFNKSNPLYPLMGKDKIDIMTYNQPKSFTQRGALDKFVTSLLGVSENVKSNATDKDPTLKIPFTINEGEIAEYSKPDLRISGFGVWFSGIYILSLAGISFMIYKLLRDKKYELLSYILAFLVVSFVLVLIVDGSWWARYVPYIYLLPILVCVLFANQQKVWYKVLAGFLCSLISLNLMMVGYTAITHTVNKYIAIEKNIKNMKKISRANECVEVSLKTDGFVSLLYNFRDRNITVKQKEKQELENPKYVNQFFYNNIK